MQSLLFELADAVDGAVHKTKGAFEDIDVGMGADGTPTTRIDKIAEDAILKLLAKKGNPLNVLSEECEFKDFGRDMTLVMDPIDGTVNATGGIPFYSVSLAVGKRDTDGIIYGLVMNLETKEAYYAAKGKGAFRNGEKIHVRKYVPEKSVFLVYLGNHAAARAYKIAAISRRTRSLGSAALETCLVASGGADLYTVLTDKAIRGLRVVDVAAAALILREAGGECYDATGKRFNMCFDIKQRSNMIAVGDTRVLGAIG